MKYSFFGTCANDNKHLFSCLKTILNQSLLPKEIVIVDSGNKSQKEKLLKFISNRNIKLIYIFKNLPRVKALNLAIKKTNAEYLIRFDTRTRFFKDYAFNAITIMKKFNKKFVGGVPYVIPENKKFMSILCAGIMSRPYIFFYPRHRILGFEGTSSSVYLGCFESNILKETLYSEEINLISEDSLLAINLSKKGFPPYISKKIRIKYVARSSIINIFRLFKTYGFCRANTIIGFKKLHSLKRYLLVLITFFIYFLLFPFNLYAKLISLPFIVLVYNLFSEILSKNQEKKLIYPILATYCQFIWFFGLVRGLSQCFSIKNEKSNFIS